MDRWAFATVYKSEYRNRQFQMPSDRSAIASWLCFNRFYSTGRNVIRLFYFARVVSSVEGREKVVRLKPDLYDLKWVRKCPFKNKKRIFTEKELRGLVSYCPILFFLLDERLPLVCQPPWSFPIQSFSITDTWSQLKLLKQLPNLIPKVTYLSHKKKMHKCIYSWNLQ